MSVKKTLVDYCLMRELAKTSERQFYANVSVFLTWAGGEDFPIAEFTGAKISEFLVAKQDAGCSAHYRRSLRNHLKALHRFSRDYENCDKIRPVKLTDLNPVSWSPAEVARLVLACDYLPYRERDYWRTLIQVAYYTGLNHCDLRRIERNNIDAAGLIPFNRSKTGARVFVAIPVALAGEILARAPETGPVWPLLVSLESFRKRFDRLVRIAKIPFGTFKRLRKTSGTLVELNSPGAGHRHLGNGAQIFEQHYEDRRVTQSNPTMPPILAGLE